MKRIARIITLICIGAALYGCAPKAQEVPMETFVDIWIQAQSDSAFKVKYAKPFEEVTAADLEAFAKPYGYTGADMKFTTSEIISKNKNKENEFLERMNEATLRTLNEKPDTSAVIESKK
ncbi:hypothetical protein L6Q79_12100 [bacterium]|nr:hypothetical protein [bacterium]NUN45845.1 hypothetical protein [bacterium]